MSAFLFGGFCLFAPQDFYAEPPTSLNLPTVFPSWQSALWGKCVKELYTNQRKFDFGANFAAFQIPV
jgi:hypothetical protein